MNLKIINFDEEVLSCSFIWLKDPVIKSMTGAPDFSKESQLCWYSSLSSMSNYIIKGITADGLPIGVLGLRNIDKEKGCGEYFGYIGEKSYWGKGVGKWMMSATEKLALENCINEILLKVVIDNFRAINLYCSTGYRIYRLDGNIYEMRKKLILNG